MAIWRRFYAPPGASLLAGVFILSLMIFPVLVLQADLTLESAAKRHLAPALALGVSWWAAIRHVLLPASWAELIPAALLQTGRALGETMAVLFGNRFFCVELGLGFSILSGGLTLACMVLPLFVRCAEQALRSCPGSYRQAALALDISRVGFIWRIMLPHAMPGIAVGLVLAAGRALAETAVLLFTAGYVTRWPETWFDSGRTLAVHIYDLAMNVTGGTAPAAATALVLLGLSITIQALAHGIVRWQARGNAK